MRVLVIGIHGFLGSEIALECQRRNWLVEGVYNSTIKESLFTTYHHSQIPELAKNNYDIIFLVAAYIPYSNYNTPSQHFIESNVNLVGLVVKTFSLSKIVFSSSVAVYGNNNQLPIKENSSFENPTLYGLSKIAGEFIVKQASKYAIVRFSSLFGKSMTSDTFINRVIQQAKEKKTIAIWGDGSRLQNYIHIKDAVGYMIAAALNPSNDVYLGVHSHSISNRDIATWVAEELHSDISFINEDKSPSYVYDNLFTTSSLKYIPAADIKAAIIEMI